MSAETFDLLSAMRATADAYRQRYADPPAPQPLLVPKWLIPLRSQVCHETADEAAAWVDAEARRYGFDGYVTYEQPAREPLAASSARPPAAPAHSGSSRSPSTATRGADPAPW